MKLLVGLGNPGKSYARHRHNVGFMALERIAARHGLGPWRKRFRGLVAEGQIGGRRVVLLMPQTYMNDSGQAVGEARRYLKIPEADIYVVHDEIDLAPGKLKVKAGGGNAGHNGLRSISAHVGNEYARVRIGVGHPGVKEAVIGYVLHDFAKADRAWLEPMLDAIAEAAGRLAAGDEARFLTDVARHLQASQPVSQTSQGVSGAVPAGKKGRKKDDAPVSSAKVEKAGKVAAATPTETAASAPPPQTHPKTHSETHSKTVPVAAAPAPRRGGSLADSLKRWLRGRG